MPLVTTATDQTWETWDDPVRGRVRWCLLADGSDPSPEAVTTGVFELADGGWMGRHRHAAPEIYFVLEGRAAVALDGEETTVDAGALVRLPGDVEHGIRAVDGPARVLFVFPTTAFDDVAYRFTGDDAAAASGPGAGDDRGTSGL
jgi:quercetin dioxygenase-like cupin family protein